MNNLEDLAYALAAQLDFDTEPFLKQPLQIEEDKITLSLYRKKTGISDITLEIIFVPLKESVSSEAFTRPYTMHLRLMHNQHKGCLKNIPSESSEDFTHAALALVRAKDALEYSVLVAPGKIHPFSLKIGPLEDKKIRSPILHANLANETMHVASPVWIPMIHQEIGLDLLYEIVTHDDTFMQNKYLTKEKKSQMFTSSIPFADRYFQFKSMQRSARTSQMMFAGVDTSLQPYDIVAGNVYNAKKKEKLHVEYMDIPFSYDLPSGKNKLEHMHDQVIEQLSYVPKKYPLFAAHTINAWQTITSEDTYIQSLLAYEGIEHTLDVQESYGMLHQLFIDNLSFKDRDAHWIVSTAKTLISEKVIDKIAYAPKQGLPAGAVFKSALEKRKHQE